MTQVIEVRTTADAQPWSELERARVILASLGEGEPNVEATATAALGWLMPPESPPAESAPEPTTDPERRLASAYPGVPRWLLPGRVA